MKIICAGFWKTGTKSLARALRILGYEVYDYDDQLFGFPELWSAFLNGTVTDDQIRDALKNVDVIIDGSAIAYWNEILRAIPDAKVILKTRDEDSWFQSYRKMCRDAPWFVRLGFFLSLCTPAGFKFVRNLIGHFWICVGIEGPFRIPMLTCVPSNARLYKMQYRKHNCHVLQTVPANQLYVHRVGDGWEGICKFLNANIPGVPYPHKNKLGDHFTTDAGKHPGYNKILRQVVLLVSVFFFLIGCVMYQILF